jgi:ribosomal protein S18 acetylase RimI-like enzyme
MIRTATLKDLDSIYQIFMSNAVDFSKIGDFSYITQLEKHGFVLGTEEKKDIEKYLKERKYFFVFEEEKEIIGYIFGTAEKEYKDDEYKFWMDDEAKDLYYSDPKSFAIDAIVINRQSHHKGVGSQLLQYFEEKVKNDGYQYLFSIARILPITNCASILFHGKNGFKKIAISSPRFMFGMENMASMLLFKKLQ